jgi:hypothetical protein
VSRPWYSNGSGGIVSQASTVSRATMALDITVLERVGEAGRDLLLACGPGRRRPVPAARRQVTAIVARATADAADLLPGLEPARI